MKKLSLIVSLLGILGFTGRIAQAQIVQIDGSSTVFPVTEAVAEEFQKAKKGKIKVTVGIAGTGVALKSSAAARPISATHLGRS